MLPAVGVFCFLVIFKGSLILPEARGGSGVGERPTNKSFLITYTMSEARGSGPARPDPFHWEYILIN